MRLLLAGMQAYHPFTASWVFPATLLVDQRSRLFLSCGCDDDNRVWHFPQLFHEHHAALLGDRVVHELTRGKYVHNKAYLAEEKQNKDT